MKIAIVIERLESWRGGAETSTLELSRRLADRGHDVGLVTATNSSPPGNLTIHHLPAAAVLGPLKTASFIHRAATFLRLHRFDLVHAISPLPSADVYQPRGGLLLESLERNVATRSSRSRRFVKRALMAMNVKHRSLLDLERAIFRPDGPAIAAVSDYVVRQCARYYAAVGPRVRVVFNGVSPPGFSEADREAQRKAVRAQYHVADGTLLLLFMGHNFRLKGLGPLIESLSRLVVSGFADFRLLVVGRDNPVRYQRRVLALGLSSQVTFTGPTQRPASFYAASDVCVHPTYYDPCSRVVLEALSCGLPCITTSFNGAAEVIRDGYEGFVIETPEDLGMWGRRIQDLRSPELRRKMSERAAAVGPRISIERHVAELDAMFQDVAERRRACSPSA